MIPGIIGQMQALECFKYLTGAGELLHKRMYIFNGLSASHKVAKIRGRVE